MYVTERLHTSRRGEHYIRQRDMKASLNRLEPCLAWRFPHLPPRFSGMLCCYHCTCVARLLGSWSLIIFYTTPASFPKLHYRRLTPYKIGIIPKAWNLGLESHRTRLESRRTLLAIRQFGVNTSSSRGLDSKCPFPSPFQAPSNGLETDICFPSLWNQLGIPIKVPMGFQAVRRSAWNSFGRFLYWR